MLNLSIQAEYQARYTYLAVLIDYPDREPFLSIAEAEAHHVTAVSQLFTHRGLAVPASTWSVDNVPRFSTVAAACGAGVTAETANYQMYERFRAELQQAGELPHDVGNVFLNLMLASRDKHLPAFLACAE